MADQAARLRMAEPGHGDGYFFGAFALRRLGQVAAAQALAREGAERFPRHRRLVTLARTADPPGAPQEDPAGEGGRKPASAEPITAPGLEARRAQAARDWPNLIGLASALKARHPEDRAGYHMLCQALRGAKRWREADQQSAAALERFPDDVPILEERARSLHRTRKHEAALACYRRMVAIDPKSTAGWAGTAESLMLLGRFDEAEQAMADALAVLPENANIMIAQVQCARRRGDFSLADARISRLEDILPDAGRLQGLRASIEINRKSDLLAGADGLAMADQRQLSVDPSEHGAMAPDGDAELLKRFESLGANCEFGLVQRLAGLEPLGLLRFSAISATQLAAMLETRLADVGTPATMTLSLNVSNEYMLADKRYFRTHTFINLGSEDEATLFRKLCRRTEFLREKLLKDIEAGNRIFLFQAATQEIAEEDVTRLHAAMRAIGPATLVFVDRGGGDAIDARDAGHGLIRATLPASAEKLSLKTMRGARYEAWRTLCRAVIALVPGRDA